MKTRKYTKRNKEYWNKGIKIVAQNRKKDYDTLSDYLVARKSTRCIHSDVCKHFCID